MSALFRLPKAVAITDAGRPYPGAKAYFYLTGTTTPTDTYEDDSLSTAHANPVVADAAGVFAPIYLDPTVEYKLTLRQSNETLIYTVDPLDGLTANGIGLSLYPRTAAEISAGVTPANYRYPGGDVRRYGTNTVPGTTDMTTAVQSWLSVGGELVGTPETFRITSRVNITANGTRINGLGMKVIHDSSSIESAIRAVEVTDIVIENLEVDGKKSSKSTASTAVAYGIELNGCKRAVVRGCYVHDTYEHGIRFGSIDNADTSVTTEYIQILGNVVVDCGNTTNDRGYGIWGFGLIRDAVIANNVVRDVRNGGISVDDTSGSGTAGRENLRIVFAGNIVFSSAGNEFIGMRYEGASYASITGNVVYSDYDGLVIQSIQANEPSQSIAITGNYFFGIRHAARLNDATNLVATGNLFVVSTADSSVHRAAVDIYSQNGGSDSDRVLVHGNVIRSTHIGIAVGVNSSNAVNSDDVEISNNHLTYTGVSAAVADLNGIYVDNATRAIIRGNRVRSFYTGIRTSCADVIDNFVSNSVLYGIQLTGSDGRVCRGNISRDSGTAGLRTETSTNNANVFVEFNNITDGFSGSSGELNLQGNMLPGMNAISFRTATEIADATDTINTTNKYVGKFVRDTTNNRIMFAEGTGATSVWRVVDGSASVTPS